MMRSTVPAAVLVAFLVSLVACGPSEQAPSQQVTTTTAAAPADATPDEDYEDDYDYDDYELDIIAEAEPDEGPPPLEVKFLADIEEPEEDGPFQIKWDFGDGTTSTEKDPVHVYQKDGEYTAVLRVTNRKGSRGTDEIDIFVETEEDE